MRQPNRSSAPPWIVGVIAVVAVGFMVAGTFKPWPVAAEKLGAVGPGPYIPLSYSYRSSTSDKGTSTYRSQTYLVVSQIGKSLSTYRVVQENEAAKLEVVRYGFLYGAAFVALFLAGVVWALVRPRRG
jgi:hypothetical protein